MSLIEAKKLVKEGDEALKTGLFKWNKDFASAAINYEEAAKLYRTAKEWDTAIKIYTKCIDVNEKMNDPWAMARDYEAIVTIHVDRTDGAKIAPDALTGLTIKAGTHFRMANSHSTYINLVKKVCKKFEDQDNLVDAMNLYKTLLNELEDDEQHHIRSEIVTAYGSLLIKAQKYRDCLDIFEREFNFKKGYTSKSGAKANLDTLALTIIALNIIIGDLDRAEKRLQDFIVEITDFIKRPELDVSEKMIEAYTSGNQPEFDKNAQRSVINNIFPLNIIKELRSVKVKARVGKKKVIEIDDIPVYKNPQNLSELFPSIVNQGGEKSENQGSQPTTNENTQVTEDQRQKALDDFLC
jgi:tetratricopeptide (TPR) repeat protein